jgi:hypothetical protein
MNKVFSFIFVGLFLIASTAFSIEVKVDFTLSQDDKPGSVKGVGVMQAAPHEVWQTLSDFNTFDQFIPRVLSSHFISEEGFEAIKTAKTNNANLIKKVAKQYKVIPERKKGQKWEGLLYMTVDAPFPVVNRWYVLKAVQDESKADQNIYQRCWTLLKGNIDHSGGCWTIKPAKIADQSIVTYRDSVDIGKNVPDWVERLGATQTLPDMFESIEREALRRRDRAIASSD